MADAKTGHVKAVVLTDAYAYHEEPGNPDSPRVDVDPPEGSLTTRGVAVEVPKAEFDRAQKMKPPGLAKAGSKEAKAAISGAPDTTPQLATTPAGDELEDVELEPEPDEPTAP